VGTNDRSLLPGYFLERLPSLSEASKLTKNYHVTRFQFVSLGGVRAYSEVVRWVLILPTALLADLAARVDFQIAFLAHIYSLHSSVYARTHGAVFRGNDLDPGGHKTGGLKTNRVCNRIVAVD
jgi:hypothetical protein